LKALEGQNDFGYWWGRASGNVLVRALLKKAKKYACLCCLVRMFLHWKVLILKRWREIFLIRATAQGGGGVDLVYHMAALVAITSDKYELMYKVNVEGTAM
jgi:nucleoside-diphosphate-sugar epimerase